MLRAEEIASASDRIACIVMATSDLITQLHARRTPDRIALHYSLSRVLLAGRAFYWSVVDGISTDLKDMQSFEYACRLSRDLGFDGKSLVHPFQLPYCNDAFTPKPHDLAAATELIEALEHAHREGRGVVVVNGRLIEGHHLKAARRLLALAEMIQQLEAGQQRHGRRGGAAARRLLLRGLSVGQRLEHATARTVTEAEGTLYLALTGESQPAPLRRAVGRALGHRAVPLHDWLIFHLAFGKTVPDVSLNAVANLGLRGRPLPRAGLPRRHARRRERGDRAQGGLQRQDGVVYVRSRGFNQHGRVLSRALGHGPQERDAGAPAPAAPVPDLPAAVPPARLAVPAVLASGALDRRATGGARLWDDYAAGERIDHADAMTIEESDHMLATRLYQNTARVHFDALRLAQLFGRRLVYGGHVIRYAARCPTTASATPSPSRRSTAAPTPPRLSPATRLRPHRRDRPRRDPRPADVGALRVRLLGAKNVKLDGLSTPEPGGKDPAVVLDLDLTLLVPRRP